MMMKHHMNNTTMMLLSLPIGLLGMGVAKLVNPARSIVYLSIFGFVVFAVTFVIALLLARRKK